MTEGAIAPVAEGAAGDPAGGPPRRVSFREAAAVWAKIGLTSFGGPAGQIALMHRELVERRRWISEARFLHALSYCMLLPGPEAQQLATYIGWLMHRTAGGIVAGALFVLPGFVTILVLSVLYAAFREVPLVTAVFFGLKSAVVAIVAEAVHRIGKKALKSGLAYAVAGLSFGAIFFLHAPFPLIVVGAALVGLAFARRISEPAAEAPTAAAGAQAYVVDSLLEAGELSHTRPSRGRAAKILALGLAAWASPLVVIGVMLGRDHVLFVEGAFFGKAAVVTFGGAYAVLAYVAQRAVATYGWLGPREMLDGLGLAETTPGPLIMVVEFVGFIAAYRSPGAWPPVLAGVAGAAVTTWATFAPCFLWIFLGGPYVETLRKSRLLRGALSMVTAAVVGVILNLSVWFFIHTVFSEVRERAAGPVFLPVPVWKSVDVGAVMLAVAAAIALLRFRVGVGKTLAGAALLGAAWSFVR